MVNFDQEQYRVIFEIEQEVRVIKSSTIEVNGIGTYVKVIPAPSTDPKRTYEIHFEPRSEVWTLVWMNYTGFRVSYMESESLTYILNALTLLNEQVI